MAENRPIASPGSRSPAFASVVGWRRWLGAGLGLLAWNALAASPSSVLTNAWPQWRGPHGNGVSQTATPPISWSETNHIRWKVELPGKGHSSPIVAKDRVWVITATPVGPAQTPVYDRAPGTHDNLPVSQRYQFHLSALRRTDGTTVRKTLLREEFPHEGGHVTGSLASNSPVSDGEHVYAFLGSRGLYCLNLQGERVWEKDLGKMQTLHAHGEGSSPILHGDSLILCWDHEADSYLYAFHKRTGELLWKTARDEKTSWSTPLMVEHQGKVQIVVSATKRVRGYDFQTGTQLWECAGLTDNVVSSPVYHQGMIFAGNSYFQQSMVAIKLDGAQGDITGSDHVAWTLRRLTPYVSSPLIYQDTLYFIRHNQNVISRLEPASGKPRGEPLRLEGIRDFIFSSPVAAAGRIYITGRDGTTVVLDASNDNKTIAVNHLSDVFSATAALAEGEFYLRGERFLYCIAEP